MRRALYVLAHIPLVPLGVLGLCVAIPGLFLVGAVVWASDRLEELKYSNGG